MTQAPSEHREGLEQLTAKEKEALRLMARGHDAKSMANELSLSVHTVNERLRAARRKLEVTSSREAARLLLEVEGNEPENPVYRELGDACQHDPADPRSTKKTVHRRTVCILGVILMLSITLFAALALGTPGADNRPIGDRATPFETVLADKLESDARNWLELVDAGDWDASFAAAGRPFRDPNTIDIWRAASQEARVPLGAVLQRTTETIELVRPKGADADGQAQIVARFATLFENGGAKTEVVTLEQEHGEWRVMGYVID